MATTNVPTSPKPRPRSPADPCRPCPVCGGLECLCRPRFFAGQLLTEDDLNRLDHYIIEKNKLHNRYIHGWGAVCGLEVVCNPCGNLVLVHPGYAVSRCGDDIIVCHEETVDICKLINECCSPPPDECQPPRPRPEGCDDIEQDWILSICYREVPSRGVMALRGAEAPCCSRCSCGGSSSCGCGCHGKNGYKNGATHKPAQSTCSSTKRTPPQCEPTVVCESYYFKVQLAPKPDRTPPRGEMVDRFTACLKELTDAMPPVPTAASTLEDIHKWCCDVREALLDLFAQNPGTSCDILAALAQPCPQPGNETTAQYLNRVVVFLLPFLEEYVRHCLCAALLPPCPAPVTDPCVPLATIRIRKRDCKILRICNLEGRKFLTTFPALQYWLSWLPYVRLLRELLERLCCRPIPQREVQVTPGIKRELGRSGSSTENQSSTLGAAALYAMSNPNRPAASMAYAMSALGMNDANGQPFFPESLETAPLATALLTDLAAPAVGEAVPPGAGAIFSNAAASDIERLSSTVAADEVAIQDVRSEIDNLKLTIRKQQAMIDGLITRLGDKQ